MAGTNRTKNSNDTPLFEYNQPLWGDLIYGTKERLRSIGIAAGLPFPGEPGGPKRKLRVTDPRGFKATVESSEYRGEGIYSASIHFPVRDQPTPLSRSNFAFGVTKEERSWCDAFTGTAEALVAAGLAQHGQFPGQPGMRKVCVRVLADGSLPQGAPTANRRAAREPGAKNIYKKTKTTYEIRLHVSSEEEERRRDKSMQETREWESRMRSLPRPAPLCRLPQETDNQVIPVSPISFLEDGKKGLLFCSRMLDTVLASQESQDGFTYSFCDEAKAMISQHLQAIEGLLTPENVRRKATRLRVLQGGKT